MDIYFACGNTAYSNKMTDLSRTEDDKDSHVSGGETTGVATVEELFSDLADLNTDRETKTEVQDIKQLLTEAHDRGLVESGVRELNATDAVQAFVGSVIFASPLLVEDGIFDIGAYLFEFTLYTVPIFLIANTLFVVVMTYALLEWTGRNKDETQLLFGRIPIRLFMILGVSFLVASVLMIVWGRVDIWGDPVESLARINVIWTVGSLGAALGDILSDSSSSQTVTDYNEALRDESLHSHTSAGESVGSNRLEDVETLTDSALVAMLNEQFDELTSVVDREDRAEVARIREQMTHATFGDVFGDRIHKYTSRDIAEAFVGSIFFSVPFLVEDGVFDVADYFLSFQISLFPVYFLVNSVFVLLMIQTLVYWAGPQDVKMSRPIFGVIPRRLVGISIISFLTAAAMMTMWGRVGDWNEPVVALARISVVWTVASFGAALGDILPGESSGTDINDSLQTRGE